MRTIHYILLLFTMLIAVPVTAIETIIIGDVYDEATGEPIANAHVYYQATRIGTTTNEEGTFVLRAELVKNHTLVVSAIGYHTERFPVEPGIMAGVQVMLREKTAVLEDVLVLPGENPALPIIQQVRAHRNENDRYLLNLTHEAQSSTQLYISDIQSRHLKRRLWSGLAGGMLLQADSTYLLPLYRAERSLSLQGSRIQPLSTLQEQAILITGTNYRALLSEDGNINFYQTNISLMGHSFLSPLAKDGKNYYRYYLRDSLSTSSGKTYLIDFRTKNPFYATMNGTLYIDSLTYAITEVEATIPQETNVNYLRGSHIHQRFATNHTLETEEIDHVLDFAVKTDDSRTFPTLLIRHRLLSDDTPADNSGLTDSISPIHPAQPSAELAETQEAIEMLDSLPAIRVATWVATILTTGYIPTGTAVDIGHIQEILQINHTEGVHVGLPLRTNERLWKNVSLEAAIGYGWRTQRLTGLGRIHVLLPTTRRHLLVAEYQDHYVWPEVNDLSRSLYENGIGYHTMDFTSYAFEALYNNTAARNTLVHQRQLEIRTENDWTNHLETQLYLRLGQYDIQQPFRYQTLGALFRLSWNERKVDHYMRRIHVGSRLPILYLSAEVGSWSDDATRRRLSRYQLYARLGVLLRQQADLGRGGTLDYAVSAGYLFGQVPDLLLHHMAGNQGYAYDPYRFTLMNNGQWTCRDYLELHACWNGRGILFNSIPGVRRLRLRELVTMKMAYSSAMGQEPYVEIGCGIGNILRVLDVHSVWRVTQRNQEGADKWAIRFRFNIDL